MSKNKEPKKPHIVKEEPLACGCREHTYSDDNVTLTPCPAHGIGEAALSLSRAATALAAVSDFMLAQSKEMAMALAVQRAVEQKSGPSGLVQP